MKKFNKIISLILCVIMAFSLSSVAFATEEQQDCPVIIIPGIWSKNICEDKNDPTTEIDLADGLAQLIGAELAPILIAYAAERDIDAFAERLCDTINCKLEGLFNNSDGTAKGNSGVHMPYPSAKSVTKNSTLVFYYDWRGDPFESAAELNDFIEFVCESSGCDKVALASHSLGSVTLLTYLTVYGQDRVKGVVYDTPVIEGVSYVGELLCGDMAVSGDSIIAFIKTILGSNEYEKLVSSVFDALALSGFTDLLGDSLDGFLDRIAPILYQKTMVPLFCYWPTIWAMSPSDKIDEGMSFVFDEVCKDEDLTVLREKVEKYNDVVRDNRHQTLLDFDNNGIFAVISRYGYSSIPVSEKWESISDTVVDTSCSSLGATTAEYGTYFDDEYLESIDAKYISPDKSIDASTCLFPDKTWFIKNIQHSETRYTQPLYNTFFFSEKELTCDDGVLSRYTLFDRENMILTDDDSVPVKVEKKSPFEILIEFIKSVIERLISLFKG